MVFEIGKAIESQCVYFISRTLNFIILYNFFSKFTKRRFLKTWCWALALEVLVPTTERTCIVVKIRRSKWNSSFQGNLSIYMRFWKEIRWVYY